MHPVGATAEVRDWTETSFGGGNLRRLVASARDQCSFAFQAGKCSRWRPILGDLDQAEAVVGAWFRRAWERPTEQNAEAMTETTVRDPLNMGLPFVSVCRLGSNFYDRRRRKQR